MRIQAWKKGSMRIQAWNMGEGAWRWDSNAIFSGCLFSQKNFHGQETMMLWFLVVFFHIFFKWFQSCWFFSCWFFSQKSPVVIVHCYCPSAVSPRPLPIGHCPSVVTRQPLPFGHCPLAVAHRPLPAGHCPFTIARRPLPITLDRRCLSITVVFCQKKFFIEMGQWCNFFSCCLLSNFFWSRWDSEKFFSFGLLSTWRWERGDGTVWQFFLLSFCLHPWAVTVVKKIYHMTSVLRHRSSPLPVGHHL